MAKRTRADAFGGAERLLIVIDDDNEESHGPPPSARALSMTLYSQAKDYSAPNADKLRLSHAFGPFVEKAARRALSIMGDFDAQLLAHLTTAAHAPESKL